jgi:hypothetical protein
MKKTIGVFTILLFLSTVIFFPSCNKKDPTVGNLHLTVIDSVGTPMVSSMAAISTSRQNELRGIYTNTGWTDGSGNVFFVDLVPGYYWYGVPGWKNFGAIQVYAGLDQYVYLLLNSPNVNHP